MRLLFTKQNGCHVWYGEPSNRPINTNNLSGRGTQEKRTCTLSLGRGRLKRTGSDHSVASKLNIVAVSDVINKAAQEYIRPKSRTDRERAYLFHWVPARLVPIALTFTRNQASTRAQKSSPVGVLPPGPWLLFAGT